MGIANPIVVNRPTMTVDTKSIANGLTSIKAQPNVLIRLVDSNTGIAPSKIRVKRNGQNLDVEIENGQQDGQADFVIENYYDVQGIDVIGQAADGSYYQFLPESGSASDAINGLSLSNEASQTIPGGVQSQVVAAPVSTDPVAPVVVQPSGGKGFSPWMLLGGLGLAGLAAGGGGSSKDTTAPSAATVAAPDNTNNNKPAITGTGEAGATVTVVIKDSKGAEQTVTGTVAANGQWSVTPTTAIADGTYSATATLKDAAGNVSVPASDNGSIDTVAPVTGSMTAAKLTNDNTPTISGEGAEVGVSGTILIKDAKGVEQSITIAVGADGKWSATPPNALADGPYTVSATFKDTAGNASAAITQSGVIDTVVTAGTVTAAALTNNNASAITGAGAEPGSVLTVTVTDGAGKVQTLTATVAADGKWSITPSALADGKYTVSAIAKDAAGNTSVAATASGIVDTVAPVAGTVNAPDNTNNPTPAISGSGAEANAKIAVTVMAADGTSQSLSAVAAADGTWSVTPAKLPDGEYTVSAVATDAAGNASVAVTDKGSVDTVTSAGKIDAPDNTNDNTPTITATGADAGATITVTITDSAGAKQVLTTTVAADGSWSVTPTANLADGAYMVNAVAKDTAGNTSTSTDTGSIDSGTSAGMFTLATVTNDNTPAIAGVDAEAGATITVTLTDHLGNVQTLSALADSAGKWSVDAAAIPDGEFTVTAIAKDSLGNVSDPISMTSVVDTIPPAIGIVLAPDYTNDNTPTISGSGAEANAKITAEITGVDGVKQVLTTVVDAEGRWNVTPSVLPDGQYSVIAVATDAAGNRSVAASDSGSVDTTSVVGEITVASLTNDNTPAISGQNAEANSAIEVTITDAAGISQVIKTTADSNGSWQVVPNITLADGEFTISAVATDSLGNVSPVVIATAVVDTLTSAGSVLVPANTNDNTPYISGFGAEPGARITVVVTDGAGASQTIETSADGKGQWSVEPMALADGNYTVSASAKDAAGNISAPAVANGIIDTVPPNVGSIAVASLSNDNTPTITGVGGEVGANIKVTVIDSMNVSQTIDAKVGADGKWIVTAAKLSDGQFTVSAVATDTAGNQSAPTQASGVIDTVAIAGTFVTPVTNDSTPTIFGNGAEPGALVSISFKNSLGVVEVLTSLVSQNGEWSVTPSNVSPDGIYQVSGSVTDLVGNTAPLAIQTGKIDTIAPAAGTVNAPDNIADSTPVITGGGTEPGATVVVTIVDASGKTQSVSTVVKPDGTWSVEPSIPLSLGSYTATAVITDEAGNVSPQPPSSDAGSVVFTLGTITAMSGQTAGVNPVSGSGATPGATIKVVINDAAGTKHDFTVVVDGSGNWSVSPTAKLAEGAFTVQAAVLQAGEATPVGYLGARGVVDTIAVGGTVIARDGVATTDGVFNGITSDYIFGYGTEAGSKVEVTVLGQTYTTTAMQNGTWYVKTAAIPAGTSYTAVAKITDISGNVTTVSDNGSTVAFNNSPSSISSGTVVGTGGSYTYQDYEYDSGPNGAEYKGTDNLKRYSFKMLGGNDIFTGGSFGSSYSILEMGDGHDTVLGSNFGGGIDTGSGNDLVANSTSSVKLGSGSDISIGNSGKVDLGRGLDATSDVNLSFSDGSVVGGNAANYVTGAKGSVDLGDGDDIVSGDYSTGMVRTYGGNDRISGVILNVDSGDGDDFVTTTGYASSIVLGNGNDILEIIDTGFMSGNSGQFNGGSGFDQLRLFDGVTMSSARFIGFESINAGKSSVLINFNDIVADTTRTGPLFIDGTSQTTVDFGANGNSLSDGSGTWSVSGVYTDPATGKVYNVYHHSSASDNSQDVYVQATIPNVI